MVTIKVYGAEQRCASCVNAPSSIETANWLQAALQRAYTDELVVDYIDIYQPKTNEEQEFAQRVFDEDLWYPVIVVDGNIISEGTPDLKVLYQKLDKIGLIRKE